MSSLYLTPGGTVAAHSNVPVILTQAQFDECCCQRYLLTPCSAGCTDECDDDIVPATRTIKNISGLVGCTGPAPDCVCPAGVISDLNGHADVVVPRQPGSDCIWYRVVPGVAYGGSYEFVVVCHSGYGNVVEICDYDTHLWYYWAEITSDCMEDFLDLANETTCAVPFDCAEDGELDCIAGQIIPALDTILTYTNLSALVGKIVLVDGDCYTVSESEETEGGVAVTVTDSYDTCAECFIDAYP